MLKKFKTKKVSNIVTVGELLKQKREELGISLKSASEKLKIKISYLEGLEENDYEKLPPNVYVKGFIKNYANLLKFDPEEMTSLYDREMNINCEIMKKKKNKNKDSSYEKKIASTNCPVATPKSITIFLSLIVSLLIGYYLWYQVSSFSSTPFLFISHPALNEIVDTDEVIVKGETEPGAVLKINGEDVFVNSNGYFNEKIMLQPGRNTLIIKVINRFDKTSEEKINIIYEKKIEETDLEDVSNGEVLGEEYIEPERKMEIIGP